MKSHELLLISLSGVRVKDKELLELGMTLPGFVERSQVIASLPSLGLLTIAAYCPDHWNPTYIEVDQIDPSFVENLDSRYELVAIQALTARANEAYVLSTQLRKRGFKTVFGGLHASVCPHEASQYFDSVVIGQGELSMAKLLADVEHEQLQPIYYNNDVKLNKVVLKNSILPRYDLIDPNLYNRIPLQTTRGCPLDCQFCAASRLISPYQLKPIERVQHEVEKILEIWPRPFIELADDNSFKNKRWARSLVEALNQYEFKWFTETDISIADDPELLKLLSASGCVQVLIGFESPRKSSLRNVDSLKWKWSMADRYIEKIERIQSYGISVNGCFVLGQDEDDPSIFEEVYQFVQRSKLAEVQITILTPFPGTTLYQELKNSGRLIAEKYWDQCTLFDVTYRPLKMSSDELRIGFYQLMKELYRPDIVQQRKNLFSQIYRRKDASIS